MSTHTSSHLPLGWAALSSAALLSVTACTAAAESSGSNDSEGAESNTTQGEPRDGGILRYAKDNLPTDGTDPQVEPSQLSKQISRNVVDSLVAEDEDGQFHPWLASEWDISEDGTEYTFHLRDDVTFSDGTPFDAEAVVANFERIIAPETESRQASTLIQPYESSEAVDEHTVVVRLSEPSAPFLQAVSSVNLGIQSPTAFQGTDDGYSYEIVGSGPFTIDSYNPDTEIVFSRRDDYNWAPAHRENQGPAYLEGIVISKLEQDNTRTGALQSASVDAIGAVPALDAERLQAEGYSFTSTEAGGLPATYWLNADREPFDDQQVREAFRASIDIDSIIPTLYGEVINRGWSVITPNTLYYDESVEGTWGYDLDHAAELLDEAGWDEFDDDGYRINSDGDRLTVIALQDSSSREQRDQFTLALQDSAADAGFYVDVDFVESGTISERTNEGDYDLRLSSFGRTDPDILKMNLWSEAIPPAGQNNARITDDYVDQLLLDGAAELDETQRAQLYSDLQHHINEQVYGFPAFVPAFTIAYNEHVQGLEVDAAQLPTFHETWLTD